MNKFLYFFFIGVICSGCATGYQTQSFTGGYTSMPIQDGVFRVSFVGNGYTSAQRATDFALLRSAEVALENEYSYFVILGENRDSKTMTYTTPVTANTTGNLNVYGGNNYAYGNYQGTTTYSGGNTVFINKPSTDMTIQCFKEKPDISGMVYDVEQVKNNLKQAYKIK